MSGERVSVLGPAVTATADAFQLAEGPVWDAGREELLWVDIAAHALFVGRLDASGMISLIERVDCDGPVSAVAIAPVGDWLLVVGDRLIRRTRDGAVNDSLTMTTSSGERFGESRRANDAKLDPWGRMVVGTLDARSEEAGELLLRLEPDSRFSILDDDLGLANGLAWSGDGRVLFTVDSLRRCIFKRSYSRHAVGRREIHITFAEGLPDGICVDEEDHLWVAMWGLGQVQRFDASGTLVAVLPVPAPHTTSVTFAGVNRDLLVVTTATSGLSEDELRRNPLSGRLFTYTPGVRGVRRESRPPEEITASHSLDTVCAEPADGSAPSRRERAEEEPCRAEAAFEMGQE